MTRKPPDGRVGLGRSLLLTLLLLNNFNSFAGAQQQQQQQQQLSYYEEPLSGISQGKSTWVEAANDDLDKAKQNQKHHVKNEDPLRYSAPSTDVRALATLAPDGRGLHGKAVRAPLAERTANRPRKGGSLSSRLPARSLQDWEVEDFILLATVDGKIHARNRKTGEKKWEVEADKPVVETEYYPANSSDEVSMLETAVNDNFLWIVEPSQDGRLYTYTPSGGMRKLPLTVKKIVEEHSPYENDDPPVVFLGDKKTTLYTIDGASGRVSKMFSSGGSAVYNSNICRRPDALEALDDEECGSRSSLTLARIDYTVSVTNRESGKPICTIRYFEWTYNNRDKDLAGQHRTSKDNRYIYSLHDGWIIAFDHVQETKGLSPEETGRFGYRVKLDSPVIQVYDVVRPVHSTAYDTPLAILPQPKDNVDYLNRDDDDNVFVNCTEAGSWYALSEKTYPLVTQDAPVCSKHDGVFGHHPVDWASQVQLTKSLVGVHSLSLSDSPQLPDLLGLDAPEYPSPPKLGAPGDYDDNGSARIDPPPETLLSKTRRSYLSTVLVSVVAGLAIAGFRFWKVASPSATNELSRPKESSPLVVPDQGVESVNGAVPEVKTGKSLGVRFDEDLKEVASAEAPTTELDLEESALDLTPQDSLEGDDQGADKKSKSHRGKRGGRRVAEKRKLKATLEQNDVVGSIVAGVEQLGQDVAVKPDVVSTTPSESASPMRGLQNLIIRNEKVLGSGSGGTFVFEGSFEGRDVAVKRMLPQFFELASQEVSLLEQSEEHPNVIRYFCRRQDENFLYIALELCQASLWDLFRDGKGEDSLDEKLSALVKDINSSPVRVLRQLAEGIKYLHAFRIVHRDVKPQNMLIAYPKKNTLDTFPRFVISDFGLCKTLPEDASTLIGTTGNAGTAGWKAPELISQPREGSGSQSSFSKDSSNGDPLTNALSIKRACDIFSLGCVFFYVLTQGRHPFDDEEGWTALRERNIKINRYNLGSIEIHGPDTIDLIRWMLSPNPEERPTAAEVLAHPFFWDAEDRLEFLSLASDRFDMEPRDGKSDALEELENHADEIIGKAPNNLSLTANSHSYSAQHKRSLSSSSGPLSNGYALALNVPERNFFAALDRKFIDTLGKQRKYNGAKLADLLRALRNKHHHWDDMPDDVKQKVGQVPDGYLRYWEQRFPALVVGVWRTVRYLGMNQERRFSRFFGAKGV